ncbi:hypothetical protein H5410_064157 [Solanum commersonii]|uniref:Uncharacterized protein n=1 Tax=Solanum commersonii TaxID=4109 RepID=A0A9J5W074_SOLCO|nr:hypothetical protein H5410_064157 [Solanum commersonii]
MAKSTTPQTEDFGAYSVEKPLDEHVFEEMEVVSMAVSSTMSERLFEGDLPEGTGQMSCILNAGAKLVAVQSLASLRGVDQLTLIDERCLTPMGTDFEDNGEEEEEPQLIWRQRVDGSRQETPDIANKETSPVRRADSGEERQRKGKGKLVKAHLKGQRKKYKTRSITQKVLGGAMEANATHTERIRKRRPKGSLDAEPTSTPVNIDDNDTQSENIIRYVIKCKREAEEERVNSKKSHKRAKKSIAKKGKNTKKKMAQLGSPEVKENSERFEEQQPVKGPGPRVRNQKAVKEITREERVKIMETQKSHLFGPPPPYLHEPEVHEFFYNLELLEDGGITTTVKDISIHLDEVTLEIILGVPVKGIRSIEGCKPSDGFTVQATKRTGS